MTERLHWGCGPVVAAGYVNSDRVQQSPTAPEHLGDILGGLPASWSRRFDVIVSHHALQMLTADEAKRALVELLRVTAAGGWLRVSVPDIRAAVGAATPVRPWPRNSFLNDLFPGSATPGEALNRYLTHYGQRSYWTAEFLMDVCDQAGWGRVECAAHGITGSPHPEAVELDNRPCESVYVEAVKP